MTVGQLGRQLLIVLLRGHFGSGIGAVSTPGYLLLCWFLPPAAMLLSSCQLRFQRRHPLLQL